MRFNPGTSAGFTPAGIASFSDLRPAAVVRELVQNAYDAAQEAKRDKAVVRFCLSTMRTDDIPGIDAYVAALNAAISTHSEMGGLAAKAKSVVATMESALRRKDQPVLSILDNGVGLVERTMTALLSDGVSAKGREASGTYGNGHSVAIPASDLRYLLYGGVSMTGNAICAGHAVLASHAPIDNRSEHLCSGDGFLVDGFLNGRNGRLFKFAKDDQIPAAISGCLDEVRRDSQHGSAVIIPAFNNFRRKGKSLWQMVSEATACNFFHAVVADRLVVHVEDRVANGDPDIQTLDRSNIAKILIANREKKRSKAFISGEKAYDAYQALKRGISHTVKTSYGSLRIHILYKPTGPPKVNLCRNGMWIADDTGIPGFYYKFRDRRPFHALLLLDPNGDEELYRLVSEAEGPLHDKFDLKSMSDEDRKDFRTAFVEIRTWLLANTDKLSDTSFSPQGYLSLDFGDSPDASWGTPEAIGQRAPERRPIRTEGSSKPSEKDNSRIRPSGRARRQRVMPFFSAVSVPIAVDRRRIAIVCRRDCKRAELELSVDENIDSTCDRVRRDAVSIVVLRDIVINGHTADESSVVERDGQTVGVRLGDLTKGQEITVEASYSLPTYFDGVEASTVSLLIDIASQSDGDDL